MIIIIIVGYSCSIIMIQRSYRDDINVIYSNRKMSLSRMNFSDIKIATKIIIQILIYIHMTINKQFLLNSCYYVNTSLIVRTCVHVCVCVMTLNNLLKLYQIWEVIQNFINDFTTIRSKWIPCQTRKQNTMNNKNYNM